MNRIDSAIKIARDEVAVSRQVPITHFNSPTVLESQNGAIFSVIAISGVPFETEKTDAINHYHRIWHRALTALDERFALIGTLHRRKITCQLDGHFSNDFAQYFDQEYSKQFNNQSMYVNDLYLTVIFRGIATRQSRQLTAIFQKLSSRYVVEARASRRQQMMKQLKEAVFQLMTSLAEFGPQLMGDQDQSCGYSELLAYISLLVNGGEALRLTGQQYGSMGNSFKKAHQATSLYPNGNLSQYISAKRIFFGEYIQFQGALSEDRRFAAMVSIKRYSSDTASIMLDPLLHLDGEFITTHSFLFETKTQADTVMNRHSNKLQNANDPAISQIDALSTARDMLASDQIAMGYHHNTVMLLSDSIQDLEHQVANTITCYMNAGMVAVRETLGQEAAFWAQIPTNFKFMTRSSLITSQNFVDFFPLHNYRTGFVDSNHLGSAMMLIETPSRTPLWLNLHAKGSKDNLSPGHTTLIGGNGSGKTVAMCCFDAQLNRYGGKSYFFDRNRGTEIYIRASGGHYSVLSPNHANDIQFNPFSLPDTAINRQFCKELLVQLVKKDGEIEVEESIVEALEHCVNYAFEKLAPEHRYLSNVTKLLPVGFDRWRRLKRWLRGDESRADGDYAYLFDNAVDDLTLPSKMGFDMTHFLDHEPPMVLAALTMYLFHRIELTLQTGGQLVSIFLDEAWQYLDNPYWQVKLNKWLPTLRKANCHIVFATQSPKSVVSSPISHTILDNCATHIYFANPQAKAAHYIDGFNLTESEFSCIQGNEPQSRLFLYKQGHQSALGKLNLGHLNDIVKILSGTQATVNLLTQIRQEVGDNPQDWLPIFLNRSAIQ